jgi:hypothetical protein
MSDGKFKLELMSLNVRSVWQLKKAENTQHMCKLCKSNLLKPTAEDIASGNTDTSIVFGKCGHAYHKDCMSNYLNKKNLSCPIDFTPWAVASESNSKIGLKQFLEQIKTK